ncbi:methyltransferase family protein [Clostridium folliculivorans]|uniref:Membrane protein n=1 Tax=Clostridium folliculivorans TaxID=2886038 RepID=A0A9W6DDA5_9CLOT|nr:isoprenylcysteine carboxylmethyltransferase family protein [Clostridium folliculivorans]GKU27408.1 membrane protein [Clostridium folliculivorans]GKU32259.1 membrane protein [Clostridium folliculivorans]
MENNKKQSKAKVYVVPVVLIAIMWLILFIPAGTLKFWEAWVLWSGFSLITFFITVYFSKKNPEFLERRAKVKEKETTKKAPAFLKLYYLGFILPGIDFRFNWSHETVWFILLANLIVFATYIFIFYVFKVNTYASTVIQVEKKQEVITTGPYSIVRHPMYSGMVIISLFMPLALGSYFALIPMLLIIPLMVFRINGEEEVLSRSLKGYKEYSLKTPYRLIPFVW